MSAEPRRATTFLPVALAWSLGLFGLLRTPWVEERLALAHHDRRATGVVIGGLLSHLLPIAVTLECKEAPSER